MKILTVFSEIVNYAVLWFILINAIKTTCLKPLDWILVTIDILFSYFVRYISYIASRGD